MGLDEDVKASASWEATHGQLVSPLLIFIFRQICFCFARPPNYIVSFKYEVGVFACFRLFACVPKIFRCVLEDLMESTDHDISDNWNRSFQFELFLGQD